MENPRLFTFNKALHFEMSEPVAWNILQAKNFFLSLSLLFWSKEDDFDPSCCQIHESNSKIVSFLKGLTCTYSQTSSYSTVLYIVRTIWSLGNINCFLSCLRISLAVTLTPIFAKTFFHRAGMQLHKLSNEKDRACISNYHTF